MTEQKTYSSLDNGRPDAELSLPRSAIYVADGALYKSTPEGETIARHELSDMHDLTVHRSLDPFAVVLGLAGVALVYFPYTFIEQMFFRWALIAVGLILVAFAVLGSTSNKIQFVCRDQLIRYTVLDEYEELVGFVNTLGTRVR